MKNSTKIKYSIIITLSTVFFLSASYFWLNHLESNRMISEYHQVKGEVVVIFEQDLDEKELEVFTKAYYSPLEVIRHKEDYALFRITDEEDYQKILKSMHQDPMVKAAQANYGISAMSNDRYADTQWAINNPGFFSKFTKIGKQISNSKTDIDMDVIEAWDHIKQDGRGRRGVVVAIIDTGVDYTHPDLKDNIWINKNEIPGDGIDNDNNGYIDDIYGWDFYNNDATTCHFEYDEEYDINFSLFEDNDDHGTHIAGIIGAVADNEIGVAGAASSIDIKLMTLKINGGTDGTGSIADAIEAIKYATMMGADIANLSWGTSHYSAALEVVMKESDMLFVAAAGNTGTDNDIAPVYPANLVLSNMISVGFINPDGKLNKESNFGAKTVDIAAPGENILSTVVGSYNYMSGTSMAAPQVSAVAALIYSYNNNVYPANVKGIILSNLKPLPDLVGKVRYPGIPNAYRVVTSVDNLIIDTIHPEISFDTIYNKGEIIIPLKVVDKGGSGIRVIRWINGNKSRSDFKRGMEGILVEDNKVILSKAGLYTFYVGDYAGNDTVKTYVVKDDTTPPKITSSYTVAESYKTRTVNVKVTDGQSGVKRVKYMPGKKTAKDFLPAGSGTEITLKDGKGTFKVSKDGVYTIYAIDHRGNNIVKKIEVKTIKANELKLAAKKKTLSIGSNFSLKTTVTPTKTTDKITYTSSNNKIAVVSDSGKITALKPGKATITARTTSGIKAVCEITVVKK